MDKMPKTKKKLSISTKLPKPSRMTVKNPGTAKLKPLIVKRSNVKKGKGKPGVSALLSKALASMIPELKKEMAKDGFAPSKSIEKSWGSVASAAAKGIGRAGKAALANPEATGRSIEGGIKGINTMRGKGPGLKTGSIGSSSGPRLVKPSGLVTSGGESIPSTLKTKSLDSKKKLNKRVDVKKVAPLLAAAAPVAGKLATGLATNVIGSQIKEGIDQASDINKRKVVKAKREIERQIPNKSNVKKMKKGIGGTLGGGVAGTVAGGALGGPAGALIGGALGSGAGNIAEDKLTKNKGRETARAPRYSFEKSAEQNKRAKLKKSVNSLINILEKSGAPDAMREADARNYRLGSSGEAELKPENRIDAAEYKIGREGEQMEKAYLNEENSELSRAQSKTTRDSDKFTEETVTTLSKKDDHMQVSELDMAKSHLQASMKVEKAIFYLQGYEPMNDAQVKKSFHGQIPDLMKEVENRPPQDWWTKAITKASIFSNDPIQYSAELWYGNINKAVAEPIDSKLGPYKKGEENQISDGSRVDVSDLAGDKKSEITETL